MVLHTPLNFKPAWCHRNGISRDHRIWIILLYSFKQNLTSTAEFCHCLHSRRKVIKVIFNECDQRNFINTDAELLYRLESANCKPMRIGVRCVTLLTLRHAVIFSDCRKSPGNNRVLDWQIFRSALVLNCMLLVDGITVVRRWLHSLYADHLVCSRRWCSSWRCLDRPWDILALCLRFVFTMSSPYWAAKQSFGCGGRFLIMELNNILFTHESGCSSSFTTLQSWTKPDDDPIL